MRKEVKTTKTCRNDSQPSAQRASSMDSVNAENMFGGDDDTSSDEADEPAPPAVSDVAPVTVRSGDEKDPPSKEPAAVAAELRAARGAQEDGGDDGGKPTGKIPLFMHPPSHTCVALAL